jgi:single-stranded-DNA-specific exonuclease
MKYPVRNRKINLEFVKEAKNDLRLPFVSAGVLSARGINSIEDAIEHLSNDLALSDPFLMVDMDKAVNRIIQAISKNEKIVIFGDFDTDGITSTAILRRFFKKLEYFEIDHVLPKETDGHGISTGAIDLIKSQGSKLIITVDNGTNSKKEIKYAKENGIDVIVTDHHIPEGKLTEDAVAILNPNREDCPSKFKSYSGGGMALSLCIAVARKINKEKDYISKDLFVLATISAIADMVPLVLDNRKIVKYGLTKIKDSGIIGLNLLLDKLYLNNTDEMSARDVAFRIAPLINAAGKFSMADKAIELLISSDRALLHSTIAELMSISARRRELVSNAYLHLIEAARKQKADEKKFIFVLGDHPSAINGLLAIRIMETVKLPTFVGTKDQKSGIVKISGRSDGINLSSIIEKTANIHLGGGGHAFAGGMQVQDSKLEELILAIEDSIKVESESLKDSSFFWEIDAEISSGDITTQVIKSLLILSPFGKKNEAPLFKIRNAEIKKELVYSKLRTYLDTPHGKIKLIFDQQVDRLKENAEKLDLIVELNFSSGEPHFTVKDVE